MDEPFDRQLRAGLRALIDPVTGTYPSWQGSPAAARVAVGFPPATRARLWLADVSGRAAWLVAAALVLLGLLGLLLATGSAPQRLGAVGCPEGSTPDTPGRIDQLRPPIGQQAVPAGPLVWDSAANRLVLLPEGRTPAWTFDVCTNTWRATKAVTSMSWSPAATVVYDDDSDQIVAVGDHAVAAYDLKTDTWSSKGSTSIWIAQAAFDPVSGQILVRDHETRRMWNYDVDTNAWLALSQGSLLPPDEGNCGSQSLDYDRVADRIVLYLETCGATAPETWLFDPRGSGWSKADVVAPRIIHWGRNEIAFDTTNARSVLYAGGRVAAYDATANAWEILFDGESGRDRFLRAGNAYAFDPLNGRLVVVGGLVGTADGWSSTNDVLAFDLRTRSWTTLLAPGE